MSKENNSMTIYSFNVKHKDLIIFKCTALILIQCMLYVSCGSEKRNDIVYLYSKDKTQVITIISDYDKNKRTIAVGKHSSKPKMNFIELDISEITRLGDELGVCWGINGHTWELVNHKAKVTEIKLDTTKYIFKENWYKDDRGVPNAKYYRKENCFTFETINYTEHYPKANGYVEKL